MLRKTIIVNNLKINYYQSQNLDKRNIAIFLHGWGSDSKRFKPILDTLGNFIAIDMPGFGMSERLYEKWTIIKYAEFLKSFLDKLDITNPILIGHSFGGSVIIKYCANIGKARKIILIGSAGVRKRTKKIIFYNFLSKIIKIIFSAPLIKRYKNSIRNGAYSVIGSQDYVSIADENLKNTFINIINEDLQKDMRKIDTEAILIWGEDDKDTPIQHGMLINKLIRNSKIFTIKNAGHFVFLDKTQEFNNLLTQFLK